MELNTSIEEILNIKINNEISDTVVYERTENVEYNIYKIVKIMKKNNIKIMELILNVSIDFWNYEIIFITLLDNWKLIIGYKAVCEDNQMYHYLPILDIRSVIDNSKLNLPTNKNILSYGDLFDNCCILEFLTNNLFYDKYYNNIINQLYHLIDFGFEINEENNIDNIYNLFHKRVFKIKIPYHLSYHITPHLFGDNITDDVLNIIKDYKGEQKFIDYHHLGKYPISHKYFFIIYYRHSRLNYCISNDKTYDGLKCVDYDNITPILDSIYIKLNSNSNFLTILSSIIDIDNIIHNFCLENPLVYNIISSLNINIIDNIIDKNYTPDYYFMGQEVTIKYNNDSNDSNNITINDTINDNDTIDNDTIDNDNSHKNAIDNDYRYYN